MKNEISVKRRLLMHPPRVKMLGFLSSSQIPGILLVALMNMCSKLVVSGPSKRNRIDFIGCCIYTVGKQRASQRVGLFYDLLSPKSPQKWPRRPGPRMNKPNI